MSDTPTSISLSTTEGALRLWYELVRGFRTANYNQVVPEYLKLSRMLAQARMTELFKGQPEAEHWTQLRALASEALEALGPLTEAARILAEMPTDITMREPEPELLVAADLPSAAELPSPAEEPTIVAEEPSVSEPTPAPKPTRVKKARSPRKPRSKRSETNQPPAS